MKWDAKEFTKKIAKEVNVFNKDGVSVLCDQLIDHLNHTDDVYPADEAKKIINHLRRKRFFDLMQKMADAFIQSGQDSAQIRRQYAQSLLDLGNLSVAILYLKSLMTDTTDDPEENAEARGLLGRAYKQIYMDGKESETKRAQHALNEAVRWYYDIYKSDPKNIWHGINTVALLCRADRDGVSVNGVADPDKQATVIAQKILAGIEEKWEKGQASMWDCGTAAEACIALKKSEEALLWTGRYVREPASDAFELAGTHRQLTEVWQLDVSSEPGDHVLPILRAELVRREGSQLDLNAKDLQPGYLGGLSQEQFEKVLGKVRYVSYKFFMTGLERGKAVARIEDQPDQGVGTGFLIRGEDLHPSLGESLVLLTNAHVVSDDPGVWNALRPDEAIVTFQLLKEEGVSEHTFDVDKLLWTSPPGKLDATILLLKGQAKDVEPYPISPRLPLADGEQRVYVIGHPKGGGLSFSIQDNVLLDHEAPLLHYRAPTEGGSSGSPVFNQQWKLIGLHHAGSPIMRKLNDQPGTYAANEGIWIQSIIDALKEDPPRL